MGEIPCRFESYTLRRGVIHYIYDMPKFSIFSKQNKSSSPTTRDLAKQVKELSERLEATSEELSAFKQAMQKAVQKVAIVRFNPFGEIGGDQSFSIALLDENDDGVVVTSHYGRDENRVYGKSIAKGKSEHALSKEEENALAKAINQE